MHTTTSTAPADAPAARLPGPARRAAAARTRAGGAGAWRPPPTTPAARPAQATTRSTCANDHSVYTLRFSAAAGTLSTRATRRSPPRAPVLRQVCASVPTATPVGRRQPRVHLERQPPSNGSRSVTTGRSFPIVTTGAGGAIVPGNTWTYFKFGDTTKPGATDSASWYLLVTLKPIDGLDQTTQNNASPPPVTITDMTGALPGTLTSAFRIHNGVATGSAVDARRIEATASGLTDVCVALAHREQPGRTGLRLERDRRL